MTTIPYSKHTVPINGFEMYYEVHGTGYPLLFLHGFTGSGANLVKEFCELSKDYQLIIPDLRGHGRSTNPSKHFTFRQAALDMLALLKHLQISQCSAVGFSGGGCTLLHLAYHHPEKMKSMAIVSAAPYFPLKTREMMQQFTTQEKTEEEWAAMRSIHVHGDEQIQQIWAYVKALSEKDADMNFTCEMLASIKTKTFIVQGDRDPFYPIELTIEMYNNMQEAFLWIIPNGGHVPVADDTQSFINYLRKFL